jgi:hypothetical protein
VPGGQTFAEILDAALATDDAAPPDSRIGFASTESFVSGDPRIELTRNRFISAARRPGQPRPVRASSATPDRPRALRALTAEQQRVLAELVALGARLAPDFTARELRSAYRALAR